MLCVSIQNKKFFSLLTNKEAKTRTWSDCPPPQFCQDQYLFFMLFFCLIFFGKVRECGTNQDPVKVKITEKKEKSATKRQRSSTL